MTERNPAMVFEHESNEDARLEACQWKDLLPAARDISLTRQFWDDLKTEAARL